MFPARSFPHFDAILCLARLLHMVDTGLYEPMQRVQADCDLHAADCCENRSPAVGEIPVSFDNTGLTKYFLRDHFPTSLPHCAWQGSYNDTISSWLVTYQPTIYRFVMD